MNKIICLLIPLSIAAGACQDKKDPNIFTCDIVDGIGFTDSSFIKVVAGFYKWYITEHCAGPDSFSSSPKVIKVSDSLYQLDTEGHIKKLEQTGFFTERFIENERAMAEECNKS